MWLPPEWLPAEERLMPAERLPTDVERVLLEKLLLRLSDAPALRLIEAPALLP